MSADPAAGEKRLCAAISRSVDPEELSTPFPSPSVPPAVASLSPARSRWTDLTSWTAGQSVIDGPNGLDDLEDLDELDGLDELNRPGNDGLDGLEELD